MAIPPSMFPEVASGSRPWGSTSAAGSSSRSRSAATSRRRRSSTPTLHSVFPEERIFRIDHYLGKESVEDLLVFRFSNTLLEPVWNRSYVRSVQITMCGDDRGRGQRRVLRRVGAIRDVLQNHLLQVVALLAMEPPAGPDASFLQDEKAKVLAAMEPIDPQARRPRAVRRIPRRTRRRRRFDDGDVRRRQARDRLVAMGGGAVVCAGRQGAGGRRHGGGRRVPRPAAAAVRRGRRTDVQPATSCASGWASSDGVTFTVQAKTPGQHLDSQAVDVAVDFAAALGERWDAYERLLGDAIAG